MRNVLVCTGGWAGDRYMSTFLAMKPQFEAYAAACGADMAVIDHALDPKSRRSIFTQKLLIPKAFSRYDVVVHMDLDVLIPRNLPDIFCSISVTAGFAAVVDPRGSPAFQKAWGFADWTTRNHRSYFEGLGLISQNELASINGGVLAFRPHLIADLFEAWYVDDDRYKGKSEADYSSEEVPLAYVSQTNKLFAPLDYRFNRQVNFALHETPQGKKAYEEYRSLANRFRRKVRRTMGVPSLHIGFGRSYRQFVECLLREGNLVHFSGKYPVPTVDRELLVSSRQ